MPNWPVNNPRITQGYGPTSTQLDGPYAGYPHFNKGLDFAGNIGDPVFAVVGGRVIAAGMGDDGWGIRVQVQDANGLIHNYGHLSAANVRVGQDISPRTVLGAVGNTGRSTGPHLSYDVWRQGRNGPEYLDPTPIINGQQPGGATVNQSNQFRNVGSGPFWSNLETIVTAARNKATKMGANREEADAFARVMTAIAYGESSMSHIAIRDTRGEPLPAGRSPEYSIGLFQANMLEPRAPVAAWLAAGGSAERLQGDPALQAQLAAEYLWDTFRGLNGLAGFKADPLRFTQAVYQRGQGSVTPDIERQIKPGLNLTAGDAGQYTINNIPAGAGPQEGNLSYIPFNATTTPTTPPPTDKDSIIKILDERIARAAADPNSFENIPALVQARQQLSRADGVSPDVAAQLAQQLGISQQQIAATRSNLEFEWSARAYQSSLDRAQSWAIHGDTLQLERERLAQQLGISTQQLALGWAQHGLSEEIGRAEIALGRDKFQVEKDLGYRADARADRQLEAQIQQFNQTFGLNTEIQRGQLDISRQQLGIAQQGLEIDRQRAASEERRAAVSSIIDLIGGMVQTGEYTQRQAEAALRAAVEVWKEHPYESPYRPLHEPGGPLEQWYTNNGYKFNPESYRIRQFPVDLKGMIAAGGAGVDFSKAWQQAQQLLSGSGLVPQLGTPGPGGVGNQNSANIFTGGTGAVATGQTPQFQPQAQAQQTAAGVPTGVAGAGMKPVPTAPQLSSALASGAAETQIGATPAPPQGGTMQQSQPACPPGYVRAWDGSQWKCSAQAPQQQMTSAVGSGQVM